MVYKNFRDLDVDGSSVHHTQNPGVKLRNRFQVGYRVLRPLVIIACVLYLLSRSLFVNYWRELYGRFAAAGPPALKEDAAYGWKDDIWPLRPQQPWDISTDFQYPRKVTYDVKEGTWLRLDVSPTGDLVFDMLGDVYCIPSHATSNPGSRSWRAYPVLLGAPYDSDPHFSPDGRRLVFRSDAGLGVENIWVTPWSGCTNMALRAYEDDIVLPTELLQALAREADDEAALTAGTSEDAAARARRLVREGRSSAFRVTNETYRWVSDARFHPNGKNVIATKWYTSSRSLAAGEAWLYDVPDESHTVDVGAGTRVIGRSLPFGWSAEDYGQQQIGPEQFIWWGEDRLIYAENVVEESNGAFEYSKDVYKGIYAIFAKNITSGVTDRLVPSSSGGASRPELSRDGRTLAYVTRVRDKEALVLKDLTSGTIHHIWYGLTYDATNIFAPMGTYPSFAFTPSDDAVIIWAAGSIWRIPIKTNNFGEKVGAGLPEKIHFKATIEKRIAETRMAHTNLVEEETKEYQRIRAFKELSADHTGSRVVVRAGARTFVAENVKPDINGAAATIKSLPTYHSNGTYYSPSFVPHASDLVVQARWSDSSFASLELADIGRDIAFEIVGVPFGRYDHPVLCECEGLNRRIAFIRTGGDQMTGDIAATAAPGIYVGSITLPSPFGSPAESERRVEVRDLQRVSRATPSRLRFLEGASKLLVHTGRKASIIHLSEGPNADGEFRLELLMEGRMSIELAVTTQKPAAIHRTAVSSVDHAAFVDFSQVYVAEGANVDQPLWSKPGNNSTKGLARVSLDGGHDLTWSGDGKTLFWALGPYLHSLEVGKLLECRSSIKADPSNFGIDCVKDYVRYSELNVQYETDIQRLSREIGQPNPLPNPPDSNLDVLVITNATLITMESGNEEEDVLFNGMILIRRGVIVTVGQALTIPEGATVINAEGGIVVPGFIDVHAHWGGQDTVASSWEQLTFLAYGCTTVHNPSSDTVDTWTERARVESGNMIGPRIFTTGTIIYGAGAAGYHQDVADDAEAKSALVRLKAEGGPFALSYKNYQLPSRASRQRLIKEARKLGMNTYPEGGMNYDWDITYIIDGMTTIEHTIPIPSLYEDVMTLWALSGTGNTPTHIVNYGGLFGEIYVWSHENLPFDEKLRTFVPHGYLQSLTESVSAPKDAYAFFNTSASVCKMSKRGLNANIGAHGEPPLGVNYHREMWFSGQGGMTPYEVLKAATRSGALSLGLYGSIGSLTSGKLADLVIYPPGSGVLQDISASRDIRFVVKGGRVWDAATMIEEWPVKGRKPSLPPLNAD